MDNLLGIILWHMDYGYCKVLDADRRAIAVHFCGTERRANYATSAVGRDLLRKPLPLQSYASIEGRGVCQLIKTPLPGAPNGSFRYVVRFDETGDTADVDEKELVPLDAHPKETLFSRMSSCDSHRLHKVLARHQFLLALETLHKETGGIEALIGSRVELFPHQVFVAGTVINDSVRRFILADEVGLGKTVEAGLVINDILAAKPEAKVLILAPGALSRQWLCELHMSFGGQGFMLADLHTTPALKLNLKKWRRVICSINRAVFVVREEFESLQKWDLVVVDEAHHLLWSPETYAFVENLSRASSGLLLLSAVPAREREDELLRLLDPDRYRADEQVARRFTELYRAQPQLGQGLRILDRDIADIERGEASPKDLELPLTRIMRAPVISEDADLREACRRIVDMPADQALVETQRVRDLVVSRYRLSRRIIKNRRSQLVSQELLDRVNREYELLGYEPDAFEAEAWLAAENLLTQVSRSDASIITKHIFFRTVYSAMSDPVCASLLAEELESCIKKKQPRGTKINLAATSYGASYDEYYDLLEDLSIAVSPHLTRSSVYRFVHSVNEWIDAPNMKQRLRGLLDRLPDILARSDKLIIFAGAYGSAESLADVLKEKLGKDVVEVFIYSLEDAEKEKNILHFRTQERCRVLISDETGGEGRNFQFVDAIVHYDLPWSVASIEQRVGRLDRIGRRKTVKSYLLYKMNSIDEGFVSCLVEGFRVFTESISGLEFMLRESESSMIDMALTFDWEQLASMAPEISAAADAERRTDDAEALTDAASFPGFGRIRFLHEISDSLEQRLEDYFVVYFRSLARQGSAHHYADNQEPDVKLWLLKPDEIRNEPLPGIDKGDDGLFAEHRGTFRRRVARERRNIEFFSVGNPLFDAVANVALERLSGRVFALGVQDPIVEAGNYLVTGMRVTADPNVIADDVPLQRRAHRYFFGKRLFLAYRLGEVAALNSSSLAALINATFDGTIPSTELARQSFHQVIENEVPDWTDYLMRLQDIIVKDARETYQRKFGRDHESMLLELRREYAELERSPKDLGRDVEALLTLEHAFEGWQPVIDVIGVLQVSA